MAKIRGIKPEFWTDDDIVELSIPARLLFIGLWNHACDNGHLQDKSKQIKMRIFPGDDVNCADLLRELDAAGVINRVDGWIIIPTLTHHQKPHKRWWVTCEMPGCELPEGAGSGNLTRKTTVVQPGGNGGTTVVQPEHNRCTTADGDGDGDGDCEVDGDVKVIKTPASRKRSDQGHRIPDDFTITEQMRQWAAEKAKHADIDRETETFSDYWRSLSGARARKTNWILTWQNWMRKASDDTPPWKRNVRQLPSASDEGASWMSGGA